MPDIFILRLRFLYGKYIQKLELPKVKNKNFIIRDFLFVVKTRFFSGCFSSLLEKRNSEFSFSDLQRRIFNGHTQNSFFKKAAISALSKSKISGSFSAYFRQVPSPLEEATKIRCLFLSVPNAWLGCIFFLLFVLSSLCAR